MGMKIVTLLVLLVSPAALSKGQIALVDLEPECVGSSGSCADDHCGPSPDYMCHISDDTEPVPGRVPSQSGVDTYSQYESILLSLRSNAIAMYRQSFSIHLEVFKIVFARVSERE